MKALTEATHLPTFPLNDGRSTSRIDDSKDGACPLTLFERLASTIASTHVPTISPMATPLKRPSAFSSILHLALVASAFPAASLAQPLAYSEGPETLINSFASGSQRRPAIAASGDTYFTAWQGPDASGDGIFGRPYDRHGQPLGDQFLVNTEQANRQGVIGVGAIHNGFCVTWESTDQDGSADGCFGQMLDRTGNLQFREFQINDYTNSAQIYPDVAGNENGFIAVWSSYEQEGNGYEVYGKRYNLTGSALGGEYRINSHIPNTQGAPSIAALTDGYVVVWHSFGQDGSDYGVFGRRLDQDGNLVGSEFPVNTATGQSQLHPEVARIDGGFVVVWQHCTYGNGCGEDIFAQVFDADGELRGTEIQVNTHPIGIQQRPQVAGLLTGFVVVWYGSDQDAGGDGIFGRLFNSTGAPMGFEFRINSHEADNQQSPDVAAIGNDFFAVWHSNNQQAGSGSDIYGKLYTATTSAPTHSPTASTRRTLATGTTTLARSPALPSTFSLPPTPSAMPPTAPPDSDHLVTIIGLSMALVAVLGLAGTGLACHIWNRRKERQQADPLTGRRDHRQTSSSGASRKPRETRRASSRGDEHGKSNTPTYQFPPRLPPYDQIPPWTGNSPDPTAPSSNVYSYGPTQAHSAAAPPYDEPPEPVRSAAGSPHRAVQSSGTNHATRTRGMGSRRPDQRLDSQTSQRSRRQLSGSGSSRRR